MAGFGAFGKMPALGDFFRLGVDAAFVAAWDPWLQGTLVQAEADLGLGFEAAYMSAPLWRFALAPGVAGPGAVVGVLMPSVDRVGRRFPLTLVAPAPDQPPLRTLTWQAPVLDRVEVLALDALDDATTRDHLAERLAGIALRPAGLATGIVTEGSALTVRSDAPDLLLADLALDLAGGELRRASAWSAVIDGAARLVLTAGLPTGAVATSFFDLAGVPA
jgi:type VI secretion system protein ImpM